MLMIKLLNMLLKTLFQKQNVVGNMLHWTRFVLLGSRDEVYV